MGPAPFTGITPLWPHTPVIRVPPGYGDSPPVLGCPPRFWGTPSQPLRVWGTTGGPCPARGPPDGTSRCSPPLGDPPSAPHHEVGGEVVLPIVVRVLHGLHPPDESPQDLLLAHPAPPGGSLPSPGRSLVRLLARSPPRAPFRRPPSPLLALPARLPAPHPAQSRPAAPSISPPSARPSPGAAATGTRRNPLLLLPPPPSLRRRGTRRPGLRKRPAPSSLPLVIPPRFPHPIGRPPRSSAPSPASGENSVPLFASPSRAGPSRFPRMGPSAGRRAELWTGPLGRRRGGGGSEPERSAAPFAPAGAQWGRRWVPAAPGPACPAPVGAAGSLSPLKGRLPAVPAVPPVP